MAIDTANKRRSAAGMPYSPDGGIDTARERMAAAQWYAGLATAIAIWQSIALVADTAEPVLVTDADSLLRVFDADPILLITDMDSTLRVLDAPPVLKVDYRSN